MVHIKLPDSNVRPLPFYLAMEEWVARVLASGDYFFAWRVEPTVICGRNQDIAAEVDLDYCNRENIRVVRRKSGGGCVFADMQNYMFSYITPGDEIRSTFAEYTGMIVGMLRGLGIDARANGRNDIVVGDRKISGNAFYHLPGRCIVHGTLLYGLDLARLARAITPSRSKLESKAVQSVPMRVTCLSDLGISMPLEQFGVYAIEKLTDSERLLTLEEVAEIEAIEQTYYDPTYFWGRRNLRHSEYQSRSRRVEDVGEVTATFALQTDGTIKSLSLVGDFFLLDDPDAKIVKPLLGLPYCREQLEQALCKIRTETIIAGLDSQTLLNILID